MAVNGIDTRDLITEMEELNERQQGVEEFGTEPLAEYEEERLAAILELIEEIGQDASYGVYLVPERDFEEYAQDYAEQVGAINEDMSWPACHIDWEAAAGSLAMDYSTVEFDGTDYLWRA
jgi:antirestriction protein